MTEVISYSHTYGAGIGIVMIAANCPVCRKRYIFGRGFVHKNYGGIDLGLDMAQPHWIIFPRSQINVVDAPMWIENGQLRPVCPACKGVFDDGEFIVAASNGRLLNLKSVGRDS